MITNPYKTKNMITRQLKIHICALFAFSASVLLSQGQNATNPGTDALDNEDIYTLSPFEVTADSSVGYLATSTLAGTRIRTDLRDVGSAISVVTAEMIGDVGATDNSTLLQYTTNAEVAGTRGTYAGMDTGEKLDEGDNLRSPSSAQRIRGLDSADNTRDFFVTDIPWDGYIASRIDIQRGPNSILFGLGSPAGIVNASMDGAEFFDSGEVSMRVGSYGSQRANVDVNKVLIDDVLAVRVEGLWDHEKFRQDPAYEDDERIYGAIRFEPKWFGKGNRTVIKANYENGEIDANRPRIIPPYDNISPWFRPQATDGNWTKDNGMGKQAISNAYDAHRDDTDDWTWPENDPYSGMTVTDSPHYQPWLGSLGNQQQPFYIMDGQSGATSKIIAGYMNVGALNPDSSERGSGDGLYGKQYAGQFFQIKDFAAYARDAALPLANSGQYRWESMKDDSIFDFYNNLIDGPNKWEKEDWEAYNLDLTQSFLNDRIALNLTYDLQRYKRASESLLGYSPAITIDILRNLQDFPREGVDGVTSQSNPNFGRPYIATTESDTGRSYESERETVRGSVFAEFRVEDVTDNGLLTKIFGRHNFNGVVSQDRYFSEERRWFSRANSLAWTSFWNGTPANDTKFNTRSPIGMIYLGSSVADRNSAAGARIPNIGSKIAFNDGEAYIFDSTWQKYSVDPAAPWNVPAEWSIPYHTVPSGGKFEDAYWGDADPYWTQASNPDNYVGWTYKELSLLRYNNGEHLELTSKAEKALRQVESKAFSWQGFFWNDSLVTTFGWRNDKVKNKDVAAQVETLNRSYLNLNEDVYKLPDEFADNQTFEADSRSYGAVLHLNRILENDPLPINVSISYNQSENFQVTSTRRGIYGEILSNPTGETKDVGLLLATKDNKYSMRIVKYKTKVMNASSPLDAQVLGETMSYAMEWRNVFLYDLSNYTFDTREQPSYRNTWTNAYPDLSDEEAQVAEDASIRAWNEIQGWLTERGFFDAWGFQPTPLDYLTDRSTYEATLNGIDPAPQYVPPAGYCVNYSHAEPQGFTATEDTESKGYELELTANPLPNWRVSFNVSKTEATRQNVGGKNIAEFVEYMDSMMVSDTGEILPAGQMPRWGGAGSAIYTSLYQKFRGQYSQMTLKEGAPTPEVRKWRYNFITNYTFTEGALEGLGIGGSYRWQDEVGIGYRVFEEDGLYRFDLDNPVMGPSEDAIDLWCSYEHAITDKINWRIQLNVRNAFADDKLIPISIQADGETVASARIAPTQEWFISNTFSF
jgi:outer membrane receptor protein involved in Fe transport